MGVVAVAVLVIGVVTSISWATHLIFVGTRDSSDLAAKLLVPFPLRAADWPELRLDAVVVDPDRAERVLVVARWPAHPESRVMLDLEVDGPASRVHSLLMHWRDANASLSPRSDAGDLLLLRRRRTQDVVFARIVAETPCASETSR
jgi:hypothetical protein